jgi:serine/threonine-protein kinase
VRRAATSRVRKPALHLCTSWGACAPSRGRYRRESLDRGDGVRRAMRDHGVMAAAEHERPFPATIGRYTVEGLLGSGAMGDVYLAHDTRLHRRVALKVLRARAEVEGVDAVAATLREARAASAIAHPNAMAVFDADETDGLAYIVMEYVPGTPLRAHVGDASVPLATRLRWLVDIAGALEAAHAAGVVHRDVKPENVFVREDGVVKVLDFGVAHAPVAAGAAVGGFPAACGESGFVGTPGYIAPEVLRGQPIDGRADQFGWGVLAYELLAGQWPWRGADTPFGAIAAVLTQEPDALSGEVPADVAAAVARALAKAPEDRFASLAAAAAVLTPYADRSPVSFSSPPVSLVRPTPPSSSRAALPSGAPPPRVPSFSSAPPPRSRPRTLAPPSAFRAPDFSAPVDLDAHLALLPPGATCKGMFFNDLLALGAKAGTPSELAEAAGIPVRRYLGFRDYPMADDLQLTIAVAREVYPTLPLGAALRRIGHRALELVLSSHLGRTLVGAFGTDPEALLLHGAKAYGLLLSFGEVTCTKSGPGELIVRAERLPLFLETYQVGVVEGMLHHARARAEVEVDLHALDAATLRVRLY